VLRSAKTATLTPPPLWLQSPNLHAPTNLVQLGEDRLFDLLVLRDRLNHKVNVLHGLRLRAPGRLLGQAG
jgi:hypothetical protein